MGKPYDFVSIGGGSAGFNAARAAAGLGKRVAIIDGARALGGLCILRGCMPSKTMIYSAEVLHLAREARTFGLRAGKASADMKALQLRKRELVADFAKHRVGELKKGNWDLFRAKARFVNPHTVELDDGRTIRSSHFLIGTGSKVSTPDIAGLSSTPFWTSDDVLNLDFRPASVIVLGGGIVACELAQFLGRIGTRVCVIQRGKTLLTHNSPEASAVVRRAFEDEGMAVFTGTKIVGVRKAGKRVSVAFEHGGKTLHRSADYLFNALGREPDTAALMLPAAGVKTEDNGRVVVNRWQQTTAPHIYAAGDCCGPHEIVHIAVQQGELAAMHAAGRKGIRPVDEALYLSVIFTDPQVAAIGWSEKSLKEKGTDFITSSYPFNDHGKSMLMNANYGYVRVLADTAHGRILGAEVVGKDAGEIIHCFSGPLALRATVGDMLRAPWYHPTLSEIVTHPLDDIATRLTRRGPGR